MMEDDIDDTSDDEKIDIALSRARKVFQEKCLKDPFLKKIFIKGGIQALIKEKDFLLGVSETFDLSRNAGALEEWAEEMSHRPQHTTVTSLSKREHLLSEKQRGLSVYGSGGPTIFTLPTAKPTNLSSEELKSSPQRDAVSNEEMIKSVFGRSSNTAKRFAHR